MSFNIYNLDLDEFSAEFPGKYDPLKSYLSARSKVDRYLALQVGSYSTDDIKLMYSYTVDEDDSCISRVELRFEGIFGYCCGDMIDFLVKSTEDFVKKEEISWLPLNYLPDRICRYTAIPDIIDIDDFYKVLHRMLEIFEPLFLKYEKQQIKFKKFIAYGKGLKFNELSGQAKRDLEYGIVEIGKLDFSSFRIPDYQRTYRWGQNNVNRLIDDIISFKSDSTYRLGTLVLNNSDIVDGQQRIVTISLLLSQLFRNPDVKRLLDMSKEYSRLYSSVIGFWSNTSYASSIARDHIIKNLDVIKRRSKELDVVFFHTLVDKCDIVLIKLKEQDEAFQFFDSQNSRGKDLDPHDLLKAFHLRELPQIKKHDKENITRWQKMQTDDIVSLFLTMFRIKSWAKGNSAREFLKDDIDEFKGISIKGNKKPDYPLYWSAYYLKKFFRLSNKMDEFPFQLDNVVINGTLFFDMVGHYYSLKNKLFSLNRLKGFPETRAILDLLATYDKRNRIGDSYIRCLFDCLMIYYVDRFGYKDLDKATEVFFLYAYGLRLENTRVSIATVDNAAVYGTMFKAIRDAVKNTDVTNIFIERINPVDNCSQMLKNKFISLDKIIKDGR